MDREAGELHTVHGATYNRKESEAIEHACRGHILFIYSTLPGHLTTVNNTDEHGYTNTCSGPCFQFFLISRTGIARSDDNFSVVCLFFMNCHTVFYRGCINLYLGEEEKQQNILNPSWSSF